MRRSGGRGLCFVLILFITAVGLATPASAAAPTISSFTPTSGPLRTSVKITGSNFVAPVTVKFNGTAATSVVVNSSTQLTAQVPGSANSGPISVTSGGATATSPASFTVTPGAYLPVTAGPPGTKVAVYFSGFAAYEAVDVYFDSTDLKLVSASSTGSGVATPIVPAKASPGEHFITAVGRKSGNSAQATFTVRTDWPQIAFDSARTGSNSSESVLGAGNVKKLTRTWNSAATTNYNYGLNQVVVAGGVVYAVSTASGVKALSATTGSTLWSRNVGSVSATPAVSGSTLVLGTSTGHLIGLNAATGAVRYDTDFGYNFNLPVTVAGGIAYIGSYDYDESKTTIIALDPASGAVKWGGDLPSPCSAFAVAGIGLYTTCNNGHLYALRLSDHSLLFDKDLTYYRYVGTPVVVDGMVISEGSDPSSGADKVIALDAATGDFVWVASSTIDFFGGLNLVTADHTLVMRGYSPSLDYVMQAIGTATGASLWSVPTSSSSRSMTIANGLIYAPDSGSTDVLDLDTGSKVTQLSGGQFAVVTDSSLFNTNVYGTTVSRYSLPASITSAQRPDAAKLRRNANLKVAS